MVLPERESRPATNGPAHSISTAIKTAFSVAPTRRLCAQAEHDCPWPCPLHGCPECAAEALLPYDDPDEYEPPVDREHPLWDVLTTLQEEFVEVGECEVCAEILRRAGWAAYDGWECELRDCLHCEVCGLCEKTGRVCRRCEVCVEHEEQGGGACWHTRWSKARRAEVEFYRHELFNLATGRWSS